MFNKGGFVYIVTNPGNRVLYTGVTSCLPKRIYEHRNGFNPDSFTKKYNCIKLVWYRHFDNIEIAIAEEKRLKAGNRQRKLDLINSFNPQWVDLWDVIKDW